MEKTYRASRGFRAFMVFAGPFFVFAVGQIVVHIVTDPQPVEGTIFFVVSLAFAVALLLHGARSYALPVTLRGDGTAVFRTLGREVVVPVTEIIGVESPGLGCLHVHPVRGAPPRAGVPLPPARRALRLPPQPPGV